MDPLPSPYGKAIHSTHTYLASFRVSTFIVYELCKGSKFPYQRNPAIRIVLYPVGVFFFIHTFTTYRRLHDMYSATFKRKPSEGVGQGLPKHLSL